jgi:transcriptional regulator with XRE-family HTH domain
MMQIDGLIMSLGEFISDELRKRDMSATRFAKIVGVDPSTITKAMRFDNPPEPSLEFLVKLSNATSVSLMTLLAIAFPEAEQIEIDTESRLLAERISQLPADRREIAEAFIFGTLMQKGNEQR